MISPTPWPAETVWEQVFPLLPDFTVEVLPEIDSSNSELMRRARAGHYEATLLVAEAAKAASGKASRATHSLFPSACPLRPKTGRACHWPWA
jgi:BirA family transcriptional regulator, biotin operon repressor / biotin---[acetyl-CoA-carboxylase] ligase